MPKRKAAAEPVEEDPSAMTNWSKCTVAVLKDELGARGLHKSGVKAELVARLEAADNGNNPSSDPAAYGVEDNSNAFTDWSKCTVAELKDELENRELSKTGSKADLVARLEASDSGDAPPAEPAPKAKKAKKEASPDVVIEGPSASQIIVNKHRNQLTGERRLREFVPAPDAEYLKKVKKVHKERMFMLNRQKSVDQNGYECEIFDIAGSKGSIYQVEIGRKPKCTCMDAVCIYWEVLMQRYANYYAENSRQQMQAQIL
jgi:SAP domain